MSVIEETIEATLDASGRKGKGSGVDERAKVARA